MLSNPLPLLPEIPPYVLSALDLDEWQLRALFRKAQWYKTNFRHRTKKLLDSCQLAWVFYAPSTRTRCSFELAGKHLGANGFSTENAREFSSASKKESLFRTLHNVIGYHPSAIIVRHDADGELQEAVSRLKLLDTRFTMPVFNAGDGGNEHPTQAYLDLFTIWEFLESKRLPTNKTLRLVFYGDNAASRTVNSLGLLIAERGARLGITVGHVTFVGVNGQGRPRGDVLEALGRAGISTSNFNVEGDLGQSDRKVLLDIFATTDAAYVTRWQNNLRQKDEPEQVLKLELPFVEAAPRDFKILHPQPINTEIDEELDYHPKAAYREQSQNGLYIRMAMLDLWVPR
jgi:aspartate carbamoyltransferase catalytic subunit